MGMEQFNSLGDMGSVRGKAKFQGGWGAIEMRLHYLAAQIRSEEKKGTVPRARDRSINR